MIRGGVSFEEDWYDTEMLNTFLTEGDFIHDDFEGYSEDYCLWDTDEAKEQYFEDLRDCEEELIEPARRIMDYEYSLDDGEIEPPWKITDSANSNPVSNSPDCEATEALSDCSIESSSDVSGRLHALFPM